MRDRIFESVKTVIQTEFWFTSHDDMKVDDTFISFGMDSLDIAETLLAIELKFNINLAHFEMDDIQTIGQLVDVVERHLNLTNNQSMY